MSSLRLWCHVTPFLDLAALWHPSNIQLHGHFCQRGITTRLWTKYYPQWRTFNLFSTRPNPHLGRPPIEFSDWCRTALTLISKLCLWTNKYCCHKLRQRYIRQVQRLVGWQESLCRLMKYFSFYVVFVLFFVFFLEKYISLLWNAVLHQTSLLAGVWQQIERSVSWCSTQYSSGAKWREEEGEGCFLPQNRWPWATNPARPSCSSDLSDWWRGQAPYPIPGRSGRWDAWLSTG